MANLFRVIIAPLESAKLDYMITGSVAAMTYGEPRLTNDIDLVIELEPGELPSFESAFPEEKFYRAPTEMLLIELSRGLRGHTNIIHHDSGFRADIYFHGGDPLHAWAWPLRTRLEIEPGLEASFAPPQYVILRKLEYYREGGSQKHLTDIQSILAQTEFAFLKADSEIAYWAGVIGVKEQWHEATKG